MTSALPVPPEKSWLDRFFGIFTDIKPGESLGALLLGINIFLILGAYYLLKSVREALILVEGGAEVKSYAAAGQAGLLLIVVPAFGWLASRMNRIKLITWVNGFFISNLVLFWLAGKGGAREGIAFYLWLGIFNNFIVAQFWGFANDLYTEDQGKRLFPAIGIGMSVGAWVGSKVTSEIFSIFGPYQLMMIAAAILGVCLALTIAANRVIVGQNRQQQKIAEQPLSSEGAVSIIRKSKYLLLIAGLILVLNLVNSTGEFLLGKLVSGQAASLFATNEVARKNFVGSFYADYFSWVNLIGFLIQTFLTSRLIKWIGVGGALFVLPLISLTGYGAMLFYPALGLIRAVKIAENSTDYSLQNTLRQALYLPTSREAKYKAKAAIDTFVVRIGDMLQAGVVYAGTALAFTIQNFASGALVFVALWLALAFLLYREYRRISATPAPQA